MSGSSNDTVGALAKAFARPDVTPASTRTLRRALDAFNARHADPADAPSAKVHDELRRVWADAAQADPGKLELFVASLAQLQGYVARVGEAQAWLGVVLDVVVDVQGVRRATAEETRGFVVACCVGGGEAAGRRAVARLVAAYIRRVEGLAGNTSAFPLRAQNRAVQLLEEIVVAVGRTRQRALFAALVGPLVDPATRYRALQLMAAWLTHQHPHLDEIKHTEGIEILLKCLMNDRSTVMVSAALQTLLMLLPHIPATVSASLPRLLLIYSRLLVWEKFSATSSKEQRDLVTDDAVRGQAEGEVQQLFSIDPTWEVVVSVPGGSEKVAPDVLSYFNYLYGLYPLNLISYIHEPRAYLEKIDFPGWEEFDLDQDVIHSRSEQFQNRHLLHPNFLTKTAKEELEDDYWLKPEPTEVVAACFALFVGEHSALKPTPSAAVQEEGHDPNPAATETGAPPPPTPAPPNPGPETSSIPSPAHSASADLQYLQRELLVLQNELSFERHWKAQHGAAIGQLKRDRIRAVTVEAETATLINANRALAKKLADASRAAERLQREAQSRRAHARQSEDLLNARVRGLRAAAAERGVLGEGLARANADIEVLRQLVVEGERRELGATERAEGMLLEVKEALETGPEAGVGGADAEREPRETEPGYVLWWVKREIARLKGG